MATWQSMNYDRPTPDVSKDFTITCPKGTDIYDKPPNTHRFDAPVIYTTTTASKFKSASVTIQADWTCKYDQGGLCLVMNLKDGTRKWVKTGVEFLDGIPLISVVTKDRWADWSLRPLLNPKSKSARVRIENTGDGNLWAYVVGEDGKKHPVREVTWWGELEADTEILIGPAAAKPSTEGGNLEVSFSDFELNLV
ncbi:hypothetical protein PMZ80_002979 [Knufia obscura]|uniref:Uncharacterized protein n=1 Tax=Knufia obscura TaxID=1635080 RepID=A0ABR0RYV5_9EURO|nr:hypothetical protein PMZ80_002979 [Knufia obscura]